ncbi:FAD/NAD(P)-binding domain-containing protein [Punctularia strigosozonata HHB-11173 SS5]|uniref:FAD/NAD(P)-binding domain-containing protein n=1 Tax=Punctularia strigosozonata (strain HHB-11173) TaxID=741275 RepID=UPI0004416CF4|nr:FAD/NAD(P)-binding domain-containing protein [Punctularia strigosozonata HHB-11173 SS5]EIN13466.1 FAD/NAD(P)-binding domain-containing protein [Punctularia strigosozonata HHB-11173 SS5]
MLVRSTESLLAIALLATSSAVNAFQLPFRLPFFSNPTDVQHTLESEPVNVTPRIAIVGAGAGGSSAAFWISKAKERWGLDVEVDVYERNSHVGGRSTTIHPYNDTSLRPIELGASVFVEANKNLWRATEEFNLTRYDFTNGDDDSKNGIWDGERFRFVMGSGKGISSWFDTAHMLWRYGYTAPKRTRDIVQDLVKRFLEFYQATPPRWTTIAELATQLSWTGLAARTTAEYFDVQGISKKFSREIIEAATRVNYGQDVDHIHGLGGTVSLAASGASSVTGGNWQIYERFLSASGAEVHLDTTVQSISKTPSGTWTLTTVRGASRDYAGIILAAPFPQTGIALAPSSLASQIHPQPYLHLHVTLLTTTARYPNATYFNLPHGHPVPKTILTTAEGARSGGKAPEFNSLAYQRPIRTLEVDGKEVEEYVVKIFSEKEVDGAWLETVFEGKVGWVYKHEWDAYPVLTPTAVFPPIKLGDGFYYVNAFEPFISTMETETISARNVVDLLLNEKFGGGICSPPEGWSVEGDVETESTAVESKTEFVYGWDC